MNRTASDARDSYYPVLIESSGGSCNCRETIRFQAYKYMPATAANLQLLDPATQHPARAW